MLKKLGAVREARQVHAGWIWPLLATAVAFALAQAWISGAQREWVETLVGFAAAAMLLMAALWLNARAQMSRFMGELREKMQAAVALERPWGLFVIAFAAVGRDGFETALFLQVLSVDGLAPVLWGWRWLARRGLVDCLGEPGGLCVADEGPFHGIHLDVDWHCGGHGGQGDARSARAGCVGPAAASPSNGLCFRTVRRRVVAGAQVGLVAGAVWMLRLRGRSRQRFL